MENKFTGVCIVLAAIILAASIVWHAQVGRYQSATDPEKIDTTSGSIFH